MRTGRFEYATDVEAVVTATNTDLDLGDFDREDFRRPIPQRVFQGFQGWLGASVIPALVFALSGITTPTSWFDPREEFRRSGSYSVYFEPRRRRGRRISLAEARQIALRAIEKSEQRLRSERAEEALFLSSLWENAPS